MINKPDGKFLRGALCAAVLLSGAAAGARAQNWNGRPGDHHNGDGGRRDGDGWQLQTGDPSAADCETWEFTAQTPNTKTDKLITEGRECAMFPDPSGTMQNYCRPTGKFAARNVTVDIGARTLQPWEKEELQVCLDQYGTATVDTTGMLYDYAVASKDSNPFLGTASTAFTLTPGSKKPSVPSADELSVRSAGAGGLVLADGRADYFKGEKISITVDAMLIPVITPGMPTDQLLNSFLNFKVAQTFDTAPTYTLPLTAATKSGTYTATITFSRQGPLSASEAASTVVTFALP